MPPVLVLRSQAERRKQAGYSLGLSVLCAFLSSDVLLAAAQAAPGNAAQKQANRSLLPHADKVKSSANLHDVKIDWFMPPGVTLRAFGCPKTVA